LGRVVTGRWVWGGMHRAGEGLIRVRTFVQVYPRSRGKRIMVRAPVIGRAAVFLFRMSLGLRRLAPQASGCLRWLCTSREWTNFTFHVTEHNLREMAEFVHLVTGAPRETARCYLDEGLADTGLRRHVAEVTAAVPFCAFADREARFGRRLGWYALARILKPRVVVESGVDKGLGTCLLAAALLRNEADGSPGKAYALDIEPGAGWLVRPPYSSAVEFRVGDSHATLRQMSEQIDLFVHDSDHSYQHEAGEYRIIQERLSDEAVVVSDNAHKSTALMDFAASVGRDYYFCPERPENEFYPAGGIGAVPMGKSRG